MERKEVVSRLGMGMRVLIVRPRWGHGVAAMRLQVLRRRGWRTVDAIRVPELEATQRKATQWMLEYDEHRTRQQGRTP